MKLVIHTLIGATLFLSCENNVPIDRYSSFQYEVVAQPMDSSTEDYLKVRVFSVDGQVPDSEVRINMDTNEVVYQSFELDSVKIGTPITYDIQYFNDTSSTAGVNVILRFKSNGRVVYTKRYKAGDQLWDFGLTHL
jgi:hypothetical protein